MNYTKQMTHPGQDLREKIKDKNWTQKDFSLLVGKKVSEVNELIKGKRNITIQWDLLLSAIFKTPEKYWIHKQIDYDYFFAKQNFIPPQNLILESEESFDQKEDLETKKINILDTKNHEDLFINF